MSLPVFCFIFAAQLTQENFQPSLQKSISTLLMTLFSVCMYSIIFVDTCAKRTVFTIIVFLTLQENWDVPALPLRSALAVLIEDHLHEGRKAGNGALRIGDAGLGSAQASENPLSGTGEHHSAVPGTPHASCSVLRMGISSSR